MTQEKTYVQTSTHMCTAALFAVAEQWKQLNMISWGMDKMRPIHSVESYSATKGKSF